jgi:hypothetical protein
VNALFSFSHKILKQGTARAVRQSFEKFITGDRAIATGQGIIHGETITIWLSKDQALDDFEGREPR